MAREKGGHFGATHFLLPKTPDYNTPSDGWGMTSQFFPTVNGQNILKIDSKIDFSKNKLFN